MKKVLVFLYYCDHMAIDMALNKYSEGYELYFVGCDKSVGICHPNPAGNKRYCELCTYNMSKQVRLYFKDNGIPYHYSTIGELLTKETIDSRNNTRFEYNTVQELKSLMYKGVEIGYGAFSTYVSFTRNITPSFNDSFHEFIDALLYSEVQMIDVLEPLYECIKPDLVIFHNGRFNNVKPFLGLCNKYGIDYIATESQQIDGELREDDFFNDVPHSVAALEEKIDVAWKNAGADRYKIGTSFFERRRNGQRAGDVVYTKKQNKSELPANFDKNKYNIAIFNSSEDEFFSISKEYDEGALFPNQYEALKTIFDHYKDREDFHFYLRIHPNLASVPYKSHSMLYDLSYDNVTIIPPDSSVGSYALMDAADKVVVFNSTMGLESAYWGKPVILLNHCLYSCLNVEYEPKSLGEMFELVDNKSLEPINNKEICLKAACFLLGYQTKTYTHLKPRRFSYRLFGVEFLGTSLYKILGSDKLYAFIEKCVFYSFVFNKKCRRFWRIAKTTK